MTTDPECLAAYDLWAATYDSIDNPLVAQSAVVLAGHASWFAGASVLELGCGTGRNAAFALSAGAARFVGVDASPGMLEIARQRLKDPRVSLIHADLASGLDGGPFDVALICLVLEHLQDPSLAISAAAKSLAPRGRLIVVELHPALHEAGVGANFRIADREVRLASFRHTAEELSAACGSAGLRVTSVVDHLRSAEALERSRKLARPHYGGRPVLLELVAERP